MLVAVYELELLRDPPLLYSVLKTAWLETVLKKVKFPPKYVGVLNFSKSKPSAKPVTVLIFPLIEIPADPLAVKLSNGLVPPMIPPNKTEPVPALTVNTRDVASLSIVLVKVMVPAVVATV